LQCGSDLALALVGTKVFVQLAQYVRWHFRAIYL
jgi:hypothetical protein